MAFKKCPQCAESVQREARICRFCSYQFPPASIKRGLSTGQWIGIGLAGFLTLGVIVDAGSPKADADPAAGNRAAKLASAADQNGGTTADDDDAKAKKAETEGDKAKRLENARFVMAQLAAKTIKEAARNPDSVQFSSILVNDEATLVCVRYRAQNGFGGMNIEHVAFDAGDPHQSASFWNSHCAHRTLNDFSYVS